MGPELIFLAIPLFLLLLLGVCALDAHIEETEKQAEADARVVSSAGALPGESLSALPAVPVEQVVSQLDLDPPQVPLEEMVVNPEDVVHLEVEFEDTVAAPEFDVVDEAAVEDLVLMNDEDAMPVHPDNGGRDGEKNTEIARAVQLPLPLACEIVDPRLV